MDDLELEEEEFDEIDKKIDELDLDWFFLLFFYF